MVAGRDGGPGGKQLGWRWAALQDPAQLYTLGFCEWQEGMPEWYFYDDDYIARKLFASPRP